MARRSRARVIEQQPIRTVPDAAYDAELEMLIGYWEDAEENTINARKLSERDRDYYDNRQLTSTELAALKKRGQPDIIINRIQTKVNYLLGYEASQRTDPRGYPRTPQDEDASEACTDTLRYVRDNIKLPQIFSQAWDNLLVEGSCAAEFSVAPDGQGDADITGKAIHWDRHFADPHSREHDYSDARYIGMVVWMDETEAEQRWPDGGDAIARSVSDDLGRTFDDRPTWKQWTASSGAGARRKRIRIVQMYHKALDQNGQELWKWCIFTKGGKLANGDVPYKNQDNKSLCPLIMQSAFVDRDNNRYGFVRALIGPQDEINKRRSKMLHASMVQQVIMEDGAVDDEDTARTQLARPDGLIKVNPGFRFEVQDKQVQMQHQAELLQHATSEIDLMGPNAAMQGKGERSASGRAIMANQQGGQIEIYRLLDRHNHFKHRCYELIWAMIQQYWSAQKMIRVTDDEKNVRFVGLNRPVILAEDLLQQAIKNGVDEQDAKAQLAQQAQDPYIAQQMQQVVRTENIPAQMTMDIILEEVPDAANMQQEQFEILTKLAPAVTFPPEIYVEMSALRNKRELLEKLEKAKENPQAQAQADANAQMQQAQLAEMQKKLAKLDADMAQMQANTQKTLADINKTKADTVKTLAEADQLDMQTGQIQLPQVYGNPPPWAQDLGGPMPQGMSMMGPSGVPMPAGPIPPYQPPPFQPQSMPLPQGPPPMTMDGPSGMMPPDQMGVPPMDQPTGPGPGYPPPVDPTQVPMMPPEFAPPEFQGAPPPGQGGY